MPLSDQAIADIIAKVQASQRAAEDLWIEEKAAGARCMCCEAPIVTPNPSGGTRESQDNANASLSESKKTAPKVGDVWKTGGLGGYVVHIVGDSLCGPFPIIGNVLIGGEEPGYDTLWAFSREGKSCDQWDRAFDLGERLHG